MANKADLEKGLELRKKLLGNAMLVLPARSENSRLTWKR